MLRNLWSPSSRRRSAAAEVPPDSDDPRVSHEAALRELYVLRREQNERHRHEQETQASRELVVADLTHKLHRQNRLLEEVNRLRRTDQQLHEIALRVVLETILPAPQFLDPLLTAGPESPWCRVLRTKKALTLVCKSWNKLALPLLYEDVVLRRSGQIYALARTMRSNPTFYGPLVKRIRFSCYILQNQERIARDDLVYILQQTPNLASMSLGATFLPMVDYTWTTDSPTSSQGSAANEPDALMMEVLKKGKDLAHLEYLRVFRLEDSFIYSPAPLLHACSNLISLSIFIPPAAPPTVALKNICLPNLETLSLYPDTTRDDCSSNLGSLCTWDTPKLKALHFRPCLDPRTLPLKLAKFIKKVGPKLRVLDLGCHHFSVVSAAAGPAGPELAELFAEVAAAVSANAGFQRLVVPWRICHLHVLDTPLAALDVPEVDVWARVGERRLVDARAGTGTGAPRQMMWRRTRLLDQGLSNLPELPHLLPFGAGAEAEERHEVFGLRVVQRAGTVYREGAVWDTLAGAGAGATVYAREIASGGFDLGGDDGGESESEYVPSTERGSSDEDEDEDEGGSVSGSEDEEESSESAYDSQLSDPTVSLDEAYEIFGQSH